MELSRWSGAHHRHFGRSCRHSDGHQSHRGEGEGWNNRKCTHLGDHTGRGGPQMGLGRGIREAGGPHPLQRSVMF